MHDSFAQAARFDRHSLQHPLGTARTTLKLVERSSSSSPQWEHTRTKIDQSLAAVFALNAHWPEAHNVQGELHLLRGDVPAARAAFQRAAAGQDDSLARQHLYFCNWSQAYLRSPAEPQRALEIADQAVALEAQQVAGNYCRGLALRALKRTPEAIQEFDHVLSKQPKHVGALLARSQLTVESPGVTTAQIEQAHQDIATALALAPTEALRAEADYVNSLAWLKHHLISKSTVAIAEDALIKCQHAVLEALKLAPRNAVYQKTADQVFTYAAAFAWQDSKLQQESTRLQQQFKATRPPAPK